MRYMRRRSRLALFVTAALCGGVMFGTVGASSAQAGPLDNLIGGTALCGGSGELNATPGNPAGWSLSGQGGCGGTRVVFSGTGTSNGLGLCDGSLLVTNLNINVNGTITRPTGHVTNFTETWGSPVSLFPLATPFVITNSNAASLGAGLAISRIHLQCGNNGDLPAATFAWVRI